MWQGRTSPPLPFGEGAERRTLVPLSTPAISVPHPANAVDNAVSDPTMAAVPMLPLAVRVIIWHGGRGAVLLLPVSVSVDDRM